MSRRLPNAVGGRWLLRSAGALAAALLLASPMAMPAKSAPTPNLHVEKLSDPDLDGVYVPTKGWVDGAGQPVAFKLRIVNGGVPLTVTALTDRIGDSGAAVDLTTSQDGMTSDCNRIVGQVLEAGERADCTFAFDAYLRTYANDKPRDSLTNTALVAATAADGTAVTVAAPHTIGNRGYQDVSLEVEKTSDADGDGLFTSFERSAAGGDDVPFRVTVRNRSQGTVVLIGLKDRWPGHKSVELLSACPYTRLAGIGDEDGAAGADPGGDAGDAHDDDGGHDDGGEHVRPTEVVCAFTLPDYTPAAGERVRNRVTVTAAKPHGDTPPTDTFSDFAVVSGP